MSHFILFFVVSYFMLRLNMFQIHAACFRPDPLTQVTTTVAVFTDAPTHEILCRCAAVLYSDMTTGQCRASLTADVVQGVERGKSLSVNLLSDSVSRIYSNYMLRNRYYVILLCQKLYTCKESACFSIRSFFIIYCDFIIKFVIVILLILAFQGS